MLRVPSFPYAHLTRFREFRVGVSNYPQEVYRKKRETRKFLRFLMDEELVIGSFKYLVLEDDCFARNSLTCYNSKEKVIEGVLYPSR